MQAKREYKEMKAEKKVQEKMQERLEQIRMTAEQREQVNKRKAYLKEQEEKRLYELEKKHYPQWLRQEDIDRFDPQPQKADLKTIENGEDQDN